MLCVYIGMYQLSSYLKNKESIFQLGVIEWTAGNRAQALKYWSSASHLGYPLASIYLGVIHHIGISGSGHGHNSDRVNKIRALRYYELGMAQDSVYTENNYEHMPVFVRYIVNNVIIYAIQYDIMYPSSYIAYSIRTIEWLIQC